jgi:hypothetical protein
MPENEIKTPISSNILDQIMGTQTQNSLNEFQPTTVINSLLEELKERDRAIISQRFGLVNSAIETLESIGKKYSLTRERVRQIEKDSIATLRNKKSPVLKQALETIFDTILEHGSIMSEEFLMQTLLFGQSDPAEVQAVKFLLNLGDQFKVSKDSPQFFESWEIVGFDQVKLEQVLAEFVKILETEGKVIPQERLYEKFKQTEFFKQHEIELSDRVLKSYLTVSKAIQINPFAEIGLKNWSEVKPRDVGDKAYLVLKHYGKPEHYSVITKLINDNKFDGRTAYQETVHNELIKDERFVLIGRGIYALSEWGYTKGVVADVIKEVLKAASRPLSRDEIINEVLKKRQVKRNTILVGLSNRKNFQKVGKDKYTIAIISNE